MSGPADASTEATFPGARTASDMHPPPRLEGGTTLGRYVVLARLGAGAMGTVYAAYDPKLDRKVAVKLLRPGRGGDRATLRLQREAQALAKLSHPNVVAVHDVGELGGQAFVAMEYVQGQTLRKWLGPGRPWPEIVAVFAAAAEGLAAAHAVGLVHRDFKPDNVMLGDDGRVRVMDFGLARAGEPSHGDSHDAGDGDHLPSSSASGSDAIGLTRTGALLGTPGYMAPEQFAGHTATANSDQFAFCVALHEALLGVRPFGGDSPEALARAVLAGERRKATSKRSEAPAWLLAVVDRGLAPQPEDRFVDMQALLAAMRSGAARRTRWRRLGLVGLGGATLTVASMAPGWLEQRQIAKCVELGAAIDEVWNEGTRANVRQALLGGGPLSEATQVRVIPRLDRAAEVWRDQQTHTCIEARVHRRWDDETQAKAAWCLQRQRLKFEAIVERLSEGSTPSINHAVTAASALELPTPCTDASSLARTPTPPAIETRPRYAELMRMNRRAIGLVDAGQVVAALSMARSVRRRALRRQWDELAAEAEMIEGHALQTLGEMDAAEQRLSASYVRAAKADAWMLAAETASQLGALVGSRPGRAADGRAWLGHAEVAAHHAGDPLGLLRASRLHAESYVDRAVGDGRRAVEQLERAASTLESALGSDHPRVAASYAALGAAQSQLGVDGPAERNLERALALLSAAYGPQHPRLIAALNNIGPLAARRGDFEAAAQYFGRALQIVETSVGPETPIAAAIHQNLGRLADERDDVSAAVDAYRHAVRILDRDSEHGASRLVGARSALASALRRAGNESEARSQLERVIEACNRGACEPTQDPDARFELAKLLDVQTEGQRARALAEVARIRFREAGAQGEAARVDAWLADHR